MEEAFDPDKYLAEKLGSSEPPAFDPDRYLAEKIGQSPEPPPEESDFDWQSPVSSGFKMAAKQGLKNLETVGKAIDTYSGAPTRSAVMAGIKGENPLEAAKNQFGEDPAQAPTGEQIVGELGMEEGLPRSALGFGVDVLADPLNIIPISKLTKVSKIPGMVEKTPAAMKTFAEGKAIKQAGAMLKDFRKLMGKDATSDVGQFILKETVEMTDDAGRSVRVPIMSGGDDVVNVAEKSTALRNQLGAKIGKIYRTIDEKITNPEFMKALPKEEAQKLWNARRFDPKKDILDMYVHLGEVFEKKIGGKKAMAKIEEILGDISQRGNTLEDSLELKGELDDLVNYNKRSDELPIVQEAILKARNFIRDKTNKYVDDVAELLSVEDGKALRDLNKRYGHAAQVSEIATDKVARQAANRMASSSDYGVGIGSAIAGLATAGPWGLFAGPGAALANKVARERGPGMLARGAELGSSVGNKFAQGSGGMMRSMLELDSTAGKVGMKTANASSEYLKNSMAPEEPTIEGFKLTQTAEIDPTQAPAIAEQIKNSSLSNTEKAKQINLLNKHGRVSIGK